MKKFVMIAGLVFSGLSMAESGVQVFGDEMPGDIEATPIAEAVKSVTGETLGPIKMSGQITQVCQKKGCWMVLTEGETWARVRIKDYGFFVPTDSAQQEAVVYGVLTAKQLTASEANHYEKDAGSKTRHPNGKLEYSILASSVVIGGGS